MRKKWVVAEKFSDDIVSQLLYNRGLRDKNAIADFFNPPTPEEISVQYSTYLGKIDPEAVNKALSLIKTAIKNQQQIVIYGDYDVDGICSTAILYQALKNLGANVIPFIPSRFDEGYGLSQASIDHLAAQLANGQIDKLLLTVDCGITAIDAVGYAKSQGFDVIVTDHHIPGHKLPEADAIVWTDELAGAGVAWVLSSLIRRSDGQIHLGGGLDLVALSTIADIQPLMGINRSLVKYGLEELNQTSRIGLRELIEVAGLEGKRIGAYEVGWILGPRLNASGRLQNAVDSLNLLLTKDPFEAQSLAFKLNKINAERQQITRQAVDQAREQVALLRQGLGGQVSPIILLHKRTWHEGVIGLVAGRIKEEFYRPTLIISKGEEISKGSARSISGFNIVKAIRECRELLLDVGGHAMAAGFTIKTDKITVFQDKLLTLASNRLSDDTLTPTLSIDAEVGLSDLSWDLMESLKKFEPFGVGNPRPIFLSRGVEVLNIRTVGVAGKHLKVQVPGFSCIGFGFGQWADRLHCGNLIDIVYSLEENIWNGQRSLQLKLKDLRLSSQKSAG